MALNQIPYTNVHELNLDWILAKLKEFEERLEAIEDYGDEISELQTDLAALESALTTFKTSVNSSLTALNARCTNIEDSVDTLQKAHDALYDTLTEQMEALEQYFDSIESSITSLRAYNDSSNLVTLNSAKEYTQKRIAELLDWLTEPELVYLVNPWTNATVTIQQFADYLYSIWNYAGITCADFDAMGLTCAEFDSFGITAQEFDSYGRFAFFFNNSYVTVTSLMETLENYATQADISLLATKEELEKYATLNDVKVISPITGLLGSFQTAINDLASLHQNTLTAATFDALELDCDTIDGLDYTAFEHDFYGVIKLYQDGVITQYTGITAAQWASIVVGADGALYTTIL